MWTMTLDCPRCDLPVEVPYHVSEICCPDCGTLHDVVEDADFDQEGAIWQNRSYLSPKAAH
jgi:uncharacterized Zn finger protein (UPF0148 family)